MKILHINSLSSGGASNACFRIHQSLLDNEIESKVLIGKKSKNFNKQGIEKISDAKIKGAGNQYEYLKFNVLGGIQQKIRSKLSNKYPFFSYPYARYDITSHPQYKEADIIHLHWVANFLDYPSFFKNNKKPIVWTCHDANPFQGVLHNNNQFFIQNKKIAALEKQMLKQKAEWYKNQNIHFVVVSKNQLKEINANCLLKVFPKTIISHTLSKHQQIPLNKSISRKNLSLEENEKIVLALTESFKRNLKGGDLLAQAISRFKNPNFKLLLVGKYGDVVAKKFTGKSVAYGYVNDKQKLMEIYNAADLFVNPSMAESFSLTALESLAQGTPIVGFDVGAIPEMIIEEKNGFLAKKMTIEDLHSSINKGINKEFDSDWIKKDINSRFNQKKQIQSYISIYKELI